MRTPLRSLLVAMILAALVPAGSAVAVGRGRAPAVRPQPAAAATPTRAAEATRLGDAAAGRDYVAGRLLVGFRSGTASASRSAALRAVGASPARTLGRQALLAVTSRGADVPALARRLAGKPGVAYAEPDWIRRPNACAPGVCWYLGGAGVDAATVHTAGRKGAGSTVAVIDTGVAPIGDLDTRVTGRWTCAPTCVVDGGTPDPVDFDHGTMVASLVAAADDNDGITGVAPEASIKAFKVDSPDGGLPVSAAVSALNTAAGQSDVSVVNMSFGSLVPSQAEEDAVNAALAAGKTLVAASGNDGNYLPSYPAAYPGVLSVGATNQSRGSASFTSYGKVDVVAPGEQVPAINPAGQVELVDGTSFASPIVAGLIALRPTTGTGRQLRARLAVEGTATAGAGGGDAKRFGHGVANAPGYVASHDGGAYLVLETSGPTNPVDYASSGQLPNPSTNFDAYVLKTDGTLGAVPGQAEASFSVDGTARVGDRPFAGVGGGVFRAQSGTLSLARGATRTGSATVEGSSETGSVPVRVLRANDQAPGVPLSGSGDAAWTQAGTLTGGYSSNDDVDDVYAVFLGAGDTLDVGVFQQPGRDVPLAALFAPGTTDVFSQFDQVVACADADPSPFCPSSLHYRAPVSGTYLIDVFTGGPDPAGYHLTWAVANTSGLPISVGVGACSPNGDGRRDTCTWSAGALSGWTTTSFVTKGFTTVTSLAGAGAKSWDGRNAGGTPQPDGAYVLRVLYAHAGGRTLLRTFPLVLDRARPSVSNLVVAPNPFEPVPADGDRDTTTFAINSSERSSLRVLVYRYGTTQLLRTIVTGSQPAGRQRVAWNGRTLSGTQLRGKVTWRMEITDTAGNTYQTARYGLTIL
jgi:thermitase